MSKDPTKSKKKRKKANIYEDNPSLINVMPQEDGNTETYVQELPVVNPDVVYTQEFPVVEEKDFLPDEEQEPDGFRKLATVRKIKDIQPIPGADKIEAVTVDGWTCVSQKDNFKVGDLCVYFEVDSFLPVKPEYEFLRKGCFKSTTNLGDGFRLKTIKLKGTISQGLILPLTDLPDLGWTASHLNEGADVTSILKVKKWEKPIPAHLAGKVKGNFPPFLNKTDQERIQNVYYQLVEKYKDIEFEPSIKVDGSSMTVYYNNGYMGVCSRNLDLFEEEGNTFWATANKYCLKNVLYLYGKNIALQGELMGPGIQHNRESFKEHKFLLFDVYLIDEARYALPKERYQILKDLRKLFPDNHGFEHIKVLDDSFRYPFRKTYEELLLASAISSYNNPVAEGIVYKSTIDNTSFKVINNLFLLQDE